PPAGGRTVTILACPATPTSSPRRVAAGAASANSAPIAAYIPLQNGDCGSVVRTGARSGSPASASAPLDAVTSRSEAGTPASGPVSPYGVTLTTTSDGDHEAAVAA